MNFSNCQLTQRPAFCKECPIAHVTEGYVPPLRGTGPDLYVGEAAGETEAQQGKPFVGGAGAWLTSLCGAARIQRPTLNIVNVLGCRPPENVFPTSREWRWTSKEDARRAVAHCVEHHLRPVVDGEKWGKVVALGDVPLRTLTPRGGISKWRGSPLPLRWAPEKGVRVLPTYHPAYLMRDAKYFSVAVRDLKRGLEIAPEHYRLWPSLRDVQEWDATEFAFDFEWGHDGRISICGLSSKYYEAIVVPFDEPYVSELKRIFENAKVLIGHNIVGADTRYFEQLGWKVNAELVDTMLIHHLVSPDLPHSLGFVGSVFTSKVFWKGRGEEEEDEDGNWTGSGEQWRTWNSPEALPVEYGGYGGCSSGAEAFRLYNARDTDGSLQCAAPLQTLLRKYDLEYVYRNVSVPVAYVCRDMCDAGMKIDNQRVKDIREDIETHIATLEVQLPEGLRPYEQPCMRQVAAPPGTYKSKTKKCKGKKKDGTKHDPVEIVFTIPGTQCCPRCGAVVESGKLAELKKVKVASTERIVPWNSNAMVLAYADSKECPEIINLKTKRRTADKKARKVWGREHTEFTLVDTLKKLATQKNSFAKPGFMYVDRLYFNLLPHGTSEGRLSSSGRRRGEPVLVDGKHVYHNGELVTITDPNIQNQPKIIRKLFLPDVEGWGILNLDVVQGENMLTAWLARDYERLERLNTPGYDEHSDLAARCFAVPFDRVKKGGDMEYLRHVGKKINHARNYGMGPIKMQQELALEGYNYTIGDVKGMIVEWRKMNAGTAKWQDEVTILAQRQGYLVNVFGRKRWFSSRDFATKALAFLPASTLADCVLRMMIALYPTRFARELSELRLERVYELPSPWRLAIQVHDSLTLMGPHETHEEVARGVKAVMEQPWKELDGFVLRSDVEYSTKSWGDVKKLEV